MTCRWDASRRSASRRSTSAASRCSSPAGRDRDGDDGRPPVRLVDAGRFQRRSGDSGRAPGRGRRGRRRVDVAHPDGLESRRRRFAGLNEKIAERWPIVPQGIRPRRLPRSGGSAARSSTRTRSSRTAALSPPSTRVASSAKSCPSKSVRRAQPCCSVSTRRRVATRRPRSSPRCSRRSSRRGRHRGELEPDPATELRRCWSRASGPERLGLEPRARFVSFGLAGVDPYRMLHGNPQACARRCDGRPRLGRHRRDRDQRGVCLGRAADARRHRARRALGGGRREPERRRISLGHPLARPERGSRRPC